MAVGIRIATGADGEGMPEIDAPVMLETANSFETRPPSVEDFRGRIGSGLERRLCLACETEGRIADYAFAVQFNPREGYAGSVEASLYVHPDCHRRGIGRPVPWGQPPRT